MENCLDLLVMSLIADLRAVVGGRLCLAKHSFAPYQEHFTERISKCCLMSGWLLWGCFHSRVSLSRPIGLTAFVIGTESVCGLTEVTRRANDLICSGRS